MAHITLAAQMIYLKEFGNIKKVLVLVVVLEDIMDKQGTLTTEITFRTSWTLLEREHGASARRIATNRF